MLLGSWMGPVGPAGPAGDGPPGVQLEWTAPPQCPDRAAMLAAIDRTLGEVDGEQLRAVEVRAEIERIGPEQLVLRLTLDDGRAGDRELRGASCEELSEAAALVIAMAVDPRLLERMQGAPVEPPPGVLEEPEAEAGPEVPAEPEAPAEPAEDPSEPEAPVVETTVDDPPVDDEPPARAAPALPVSFVLRFDGGVGGGPLPGPSGVVFVGAGVTGRAWRAELTGGYWPPRSTDSPSNPAIGLRAQLWTVGAQGCGEPQVGPVSIPLCAGIHAGAMHGVGTGDQQRRRVASRWVAAVIEPGVVWWTRPRLGIAVRGSGHVALARPQWRSEPSGVVFESAPLGGTLRAGLELRLP